MKKTRLKILIILVLAVAAIVTSFIPFRYYASYFRLSQIGKDPVSGWEGRFSKMKNDLPRSGVVGYVSEKDYPGVGFDPIDSNEEYVQTIYTLAPLVVNHGTKFDLVIGNFGTDYPYNFEKVLGLKTIAYYGYGLYLFKGPGK
jgi:hypothetical protein